MIFLALDVHIKNVAHAYSLEHESIDNSVESVFESLDSVMEGNKDDSETFQELVLSLATMESSICHHMLKEEEQVGTYFLLYTIVELPNTASLYLIDFLIFLVSLDFLFFFLYILHRKCKSFLIFVAF